MLDEDREPNWPEIQMRYLVDLLFEAGPVMSGGMGPAMLSELELQAFQNNRGIVLQPWEVTMLRRLSKEWLEESDRAEAHDARAPFGALPSREEVARKLDEALG